MAQDARGDDVTFMPPAAIFQSEPAANRCAYLV